MSRKPLLVTSIAVLSLLLIGGASVMGILQTTERVSTSGIIIQPAPPPIMPPIIPPIIPPSPLPTPTPTPPPEQTLDVEIYSDSALTQVLSNVVWGTIEPGASVSKILYLKNNGEDSVTLSLTTENWTPAGASTYLQLSWNYDGSPINPGEVVQVEMVLDVSALISGIDTFNFNIIIIGTIL